MKTMLKKLSVLLVAAALLAGFAGCPTDGDKGGDKKDDIPDAYKDFYNYPDGRQDSSALLTVNNSYNSPVLLFHTDFSSETYIGTVGSLGSIKVKLPEEQFYTIVAVEKSDYEERGFQASQFSSLTYHSRTQPFDVKVDSGLTKGDQKWILTNNTSYWCKVVDLATPSKVYAVLGPKAYRVTLPINSSDSFDFEPVFLQELKYNGQVIALSEFAERYQADTIDPKVNPFQKTYDSTIKLTGINPNVLLINRTGLTVRVYKTTAQLTNGAIGADFVIGSGRDVLVTGFADGDNTSDFYLSAPSWTVDGNGFKQCTQNVQMNKGFVYKITVTGDGKEGNPVTFAVEEVSASEFYDKE